jgi:hypothetical protein
MQSTQQLANHKQHPFTPNFHTIISREQITKNFAPTFSVVFITNQESLASDTNLHKHTPGCNCKPVQVAPQKRSQIYNRRGPDKNVGKASSPIIAMIELKRCLCL